MSESAGGAVRLFHYVPQANRPSEEQPKLMNLGQTQNLRHSRIERFYFKDYL